MPLSPEQHEQSRFDIWLFSEFRAEYDRQYRILNKIGLLDILPESGETGIIGIDNKEYPIPTKEAIEQEIRKNREVYEIKINQGFTQIQLTPFAIPLDVLISTLETRLKEHHEQGKLLATKNHPEGPNEPLDLDTEQPVFVWDEWRGSDKDGQCIYHPTSFDGANHGGHTKVEILKNQAGLPFAGWNVLLTESNKNIPREGQGKTIGGRRQIETNKTPSEYLRLLQTDPQYRHEQGMTNEDWLTEFLVHLGKTDQVIDDYQGKGSINFLIGSFRSTSRVLGCGYWSRGYRSASLDGCDPGRRCSDDGSRSAVGVREVGFSYDGDQKTL